MFESRHDVQHNDLRFVGSQHLFHRVGDGGVGKVFDALFAGHGFPLRKIRRGLVLRALYVVEGDVFADLDKKRRRIARFVTLHALSETHVRILHKVFGNFPSPYYRQ